VLPLVALTIFYVPIGIEVVSYWMGGIFCKNNVTALTPKAWFLILIFVGLILAMPKLFMTIGSDKVGYRQVAAWLEANTAADDLIIVPDTRISFYAKRKGISIAEQASDVKYIVKFSDAGCGHYKIGPELFAADTGKNKKSKLTVYKLAM
jgi:hypothetical protein